MPAATSNPNLTGRRLAGAVLYALLVTAVAMPVAIGIAGLLAGPQALRAKIIVTSGNFAAFHGRAGLYLVMLATVLVFILYNLAVGPRHRYPWNWGPLAPRLFDDSLSARDKLAAVLASGWGRVLLAIDLGWIVLAAFAPN